MNPSKNKDQVHEATGTDIPPREATICKTHPLLRDNEPRWEHILTTCQDPHLLLLTDKSKGTRMIGMLTGMCSLDEVIEKQQTSTASDLERLNNWPDSEIRIVNKHLAVKSFKRSDASKVFLPGDTRPVVWCRRTVHNILSLHAEADCSTTMPWLFQRDEPYKFLDVYNFVRDRLRGVWTDLTVQHSLTHMVRD